jgi:hypothetical protein
MKKILLLAALAAALAFPARAETFADVMCRLNGENAALVMRNRQIGVPMDQIMELATRSFKKKADRDYARAVVIAAYQVPRFSTVEYQEKAVTDFANAVMAACYGSNA